MEFVYLKCPFDGKVLKVKCVPGIEKKNVRCPVCKNNYPYSDYKVVPPPPPPPPPDDGDHTKLGGTGNYKIGVLVGPDGTKYQLQLDRNVVGRKASKSSANIAIETGTNKSMSREHLVIDVKKVTGKGYRHSVSLFKEKVNKTYINDQLLEYGDTLLLENGTIIGMPGITLIFNLSDDEGTNIY